MSYDKLAGTRLAFEEAFIPSHCRRRHQRVTVNVSAQGQVVTGDGDGETFGVNVEDYSLGGVRVASPIDLPAGAQVVLRPPFGDGRDFLLKVIRTERRMDSGVTLGLELVGLVRSGSGGNSQYEGTVALPSQRGKGKLVLIAAAIIAGVAAGLFLK